MIASSLRSRASRTWRTISFHLDFDVVIVHSYSCVSSGKQNPQRREPIPWAFSMKTESDQVWCSTTVLSFEPEVTKKQKKKSDSKSSERDEKGGGNGSSWRTFEPMGPSGLGTLFQNAFLRPAGSQWVPWVRQQTKLRAEEHKVQTLLPVFLKSNIWIREIFRGLWGYKSMLLVIKIKKE